MQALFADVQTVREQGVEVEIITRDGIAIIALARALLVAEFLAGDGTDFVFVDADVSWEPGALVKLLSHPVDFVAGVAPSRDDPIEFRVNFPSYPVSVVPTGSLWEVAGVGTAFMRLTRSVLELMVKAYPETEVSFEGSRTRTPIPGNKAWMLFDRLPGDPYESEDFLFCKHWRDLGGKVWGGPEPDAEPHRQ